jgi:hypothetical protein
MKNILTLILLIGFSLALSAQNTKKAFLTKIEVDWMDKEVKELGKYYEIIADALEKKDGIEVSRNKTEIIKSVTTLSSNSQQFYNKIILDASREDARREVASDNPPNYYYNKRKSNPKNQELEISNQDLNRFESNYLKMQDLKKTLKQSSFALHPQQEESQANLKLVAEFLVIAKENNKIIQNAKK